jgi:predicted ribonuclease YlaK
MRSKNLYLFPDTNVFIQCKRLHEVDWSAFSEWEQIQIVITRPVQAEIDSFKGRGNSRVSQRSRVISAQIRELLELESSVGSLTLREKPLVNLVLRHDLKRLESLADELDYNERDDQLVGTAAAFKQQYPDFEVRLLTNDTGPMASARLVGLAYQVVPDNWVLQPEPDESDKKAKQLQAELEKYKQSEPRFIINANTQLLNSTTTAYHPLSDVEVSYCQLLCLTLSIQAAIFLLSSGTPFLN